MDQPSDRDSNNGEAGVLGSALGQNVDQRHLSVSYTLDDLWVIWKHQGGEEKANFCWAPPGKGGWENIQLMDFEQEILAGLPFVDLETSVNEHDSDARWFCVMEQEGYFHHAWSHTKPGKACVVAISEQELIDILNQARAVLSNHCEHHLLDARDENIYMQTYLPLLESTNLSLTDNPFAPTPRTLWCTWVAGYNEFMDNAQVQWVLASESPLGSDEQHMRDHEHTNIATRTLQELKDLLEAQQSLTFFEQVKDLLQIERIFVAQNRAQVSEVALTQKRGRIQASSVYTPKNSVGVTLTLGELKRVVNRGEDIVATQHYDSIHLDVRPVSKGHPSAWLVMMKHLPYINLLKRHAGIS